MADRLTIDVDASALLRALDALGEAAEALCRAAALETAKRVQTGAQARARWSATGRTREAITIDEAPGPLGGYRVYVGPTRDDEGWSRPAELPLWIHFGTRKWAGHPDFLFGPARLEEQPHLQRIGRAVQQAIDDQGLR